MATRQYKPKKSRYALQVGASLIVALLGSGMALSLSQAGAPTGETTSPKPAIVQPSQAQTSSGAGAQPAARPQTNTPTTQFTYNLDQQLTQLIQPGGVTVTFGYDSAGRPNAITNPLGAVAIAYAPATDNIAQLGTSDGVTITYGYDGPLITDTSWSGPVSGTVHRAFNSNFYLSSETVNGGSLVSYAYDLDNLLTQVGALAATRSPQTGLLTGTTLGGVTDTLGYNQFGEVTTYTAAYNGSNLFVHANIRDNAGRTAQRVETISGITHTFVYTYDPALRLTDVARDSLLLSHYSYSPNGNRTTYTGSSGAITATYDAQDRLLQYGNLSFTYTPNGELQSKIDTSTHQTTTYTYDAISNLRAATLPGGTQVSYLIDGNNRRVGKTINGALAQGFLYGDGLVPVAELDGSGTIVSRFVYGTGGNAPSYMVKGGQTYFIVSDETGSPRLVVNTANGQVAQRMDYDEFGVVLSDTNPGFQPFGFAGGIYDRDTGLVRFGARDYDPFTGRWTSKDPLLFGGGSTNLYAYVDNDPVNRVDPSGLFDWTDFVRITQGPVPFLLFEVLPEHLGKSDEEITQEVRQELDAESELAHQLNNKEFGPFTSPEQAGVALWFLMSQLSEDRQAGASYSCSAWARREPSNMFQPSFNTSGLYNGGTEINTPDLSYWNNRTEPPQIFFTIHFNK